MVYYKLAANKGDPESMFMFASLIDKGEGIISKNDEVSFKYYKMAADKGHIESMSKYASLLEEGINVSTNKMEAAKYYRMAADNGDRVSLKKYAHIVKNNEEGIPFDTEEIFDISKILKIFEIQLRCLSVLRCC